MNNNVIESSSMLKKVLGDHLAVIKSFDHLPKERRKTQKFRSVLLGKYGDKCSICLDEFTQKHLEVAHIIPLQLGADTNESNLILLCSNCHELYDSGYMSISDMSKIHAKIKSDTPYPKVRLNEIKVPILSSTITPPPEKIKIALEKIRQAQIASKPVVAIRIAKNELKKHSDGSQEYFRLQIKIAELMRRRAAKGVLNKSIKILESIDIEKLDDKFHALFFYELNYAYRLSGHNKKALNLIQKSSRATAKNMGVDYVAAESNAIICEWNEIIKPSKTDGNKFAARFNQLTKIASKSGEYWGGRWAINTEAQIVHIHIKCGDGNPSWEALANLKKIFYSSDITNGWDLAARNSISLLDGMVHVIFPRNDNDLNHGLRILSRSFVSRAGTRVRPEGIRDVGYSFAQGLRKLNSEKYHKTADAIENAMDITIDGTSYVWPYGA